MENELKEYKRLLAVLDTYTAYLIIDKHELDTALEQQARLTQEVGTSHADAVSARDYSKNQLEKIKADVDKFIREEASTNNLRVTEAQVSNQIIEDESYQTAFSNFLMWKTLADKLLVMREAFGSRAYALRDLVMLHAAGYWPERSIISEKADARDRAAATIKEALAEKRRQRAKLVENN